jgi:two-component system response regulator FlrC
MQRHLQSKLLRVIQEREVDRIGGLHPVRVDVRLIATSNRDIKEAIKKGSFREDLFYRLNTIPIKIPPLRDRLEDVDVLVRHLIDKYNEIDARNVKSLTQGALNALQKLPFRGNVRELENIIQRAILLSDGHTIKEKDLFIGESDTIIAPEAKGAADAAVDVMSGPLKEVERKMIFHTLGKTKGNRTHAAKILGISVRTLRNKLNEYRESMEIS